MSLSSIPRAFRAARTWVIDSAAAWRAAFAVLRSIITPRLIVARSGTTVTLPLPVTAIVCSGGWSVAFTAAAYRGWGLVAAPRAGPATRPTARAATPAMAIQPRVERPGPRVGSEARSVPRSWESVI